MDLLWEYQQIYYVKQIVDSSINRFKSRFYA